MFDVSSALDHLYSMNPIRVELEITEVCNLRCLFCYNDAERKIPTLKEVKILIDRLSEQGVLELVLTGGEPMSHPDFDEIVLYAVLKIPCVMVQTNGTLMSASRARMLKNGGVAGVNISLHGNKHDHTILTQITGAYDSAVSGIKNCISQNLTLWVNSVLTNVNDVGLVEHLKWLFDIGVRNFTFTRFTPIGQLAQKDLLLSSQRLIELLRDIVSFGRTNGASILLANAFPLCGLSSDLKHLSEVCTYGLTKFYVDVNGDVLYCGMSRVRLGNILESSFEEIKRSSDVFHKNVNSKLAPEKCMSCPSYPLKCRGGCRAAAIANQRTICGEDPFSE